MNLQAVDQYADLYHVSNTISSDLVNKIIETPWLDLDFTTQPKQETWLRRQIKNESLHWYREFQSQLHSKHAEIESQTGIKFDSFMESIFWLDMPGFICPIHTDGELPASMQINWIAEPNTGTVFYHSKHKHDLRHITPAQTNHGYLMINQADSTGYRHLQWHGMLQPVSRLRVTSYTWLYPIK